MEERKRSNPVIIILVVALIAALVLCALLGFLMIRAERQADKYRTAYESVVGDSAYSEQYGKDMKSVVSYMYEGGRKTEECANLMRKVWHNSIYMVRDSETDKYTLDASGAFYTDIEDVISNLTKDRSFMSKRSDIIENQGKVMELIKKLKNPPDEWREAYSDLLLYYDSYYDFTELVISTNCSLNEFEEMSEEYDRESIKRYNKMNLYLD